MRYMIDVLTNDGDGRFDEFRPTDRLDVVGRFFVDGENYVDALEAMFRIGQKEPDLGTTDALGTEYPRSARSISVGDVMLLGGGASAHAVDHFGYVTVAVTDVLHALMFGTRRPDLT